MTRFILSPAAQADIEGIWDYTAERWDQAQAEHYVLAIRDACHELAAGTRRSRPADEIRAGYRKAAVGSHVLFFRIMDDGRLDIVRVLHQRMDVSSHL
ncbi:type II toxin-antitoxin system RelE/ParE family toxin [Roseomonas sp. BN140053]|uniref:type II toxin-antitoxin system RelE/ParE family toxin n=1 Tax=Roseomonas sp. BN140053 TaxID=3391898 RepID=UPI0039EA199E